MANTAPKPLQGDRTHTTPPHTGPNILPNHPLFARLLRFAHALPSRLCIRDTNTNQEATHHQLLLDLLALRQRLQHQLQPQTLSALARGDEIYIAVLAPGGYEYSVAMLAVLALGAAVVPLSVAVPVEEAEYLIRTSRSIAVLTSTSTLHLGLALENRLKPPLKPSESKQFFTLPIGPSTFTPLRLKAAEIKISSDPPLSDAAPGVVIFTSGTTGPPKGAVMRRSYIFADALGVTDHYALSPADVLLHILPVHHATGLGIMFFPFLIAGAVLEFRSGGFSEAWVWNRWRQGGSTFFSGVPTIYMRLRRYYQNVLAKLPRGEREEFIAGARRLRACICGTSALPGPIADFWTDLLGKKILLRYGATEIGAVFKVPYCTADTDLVVPDGSVGTLFPGSDVLLSNRPLDVPLKDEDEGEILVKAPWMFSKYLAPAPSQSAAGSPQTPSTSPTASSHTPTGYYRTGDIARRSPPDASGKEWYTVLGRSSVDIIKSGGYKISALDIERECLGLEYIDEVMVVGVADEEFGERVGVVVVVKTIEGREARVLLTLETLRSDLRGGLAGYKLPTLLRVLAAGQELPKSGTGKVVKKVLGPRFFPPGQWRGMGEVQVWERSDPSSSEGKEGYGAKL
ncbi:hypothetical protein LTR62_006104 [Meristemomyces frigidus]|uniref:Acetyl-CoA synthetase-like protein n=1 Tax=Meristemomyces frigidus TaxID=1508187 RepID=A0AAN7TDV5_9PEZI|nr:hypothetical protein LTR62_006104 [Meristemomyces frigidus]